jgi:hypothetical protein
MAAGYCASWVDYASGSTVNSTTAEKTGEATPWGLVFVATAFTRKRAGFAPSGMLQVISRSKQ